MPVQCGFVEALLHAYLTLMMTPKLGPRKIKLLSEHVGDAQQICQASAEQLRAVPGIGATLVQNILQARQGAAAKAAELEMQKAAKLEVQLLCLADPAYPLSLRAIFDPPPVLYVRGELPPTLQTAFEHLRSLAIVGTRHPSDYGLRLSRDFAQRLATVGVTVVSGLAAGVDGAAHQGAMQAAQGQTIAVLGCAVNVTYPRHHRGIAEKICQGHGALVSEYPLDTAPRAEYFPARNRIINGLARGVLVVEGGLKSGALITADYALEEGRNVFAIPGRVGDPQAIGCNTLLKQGAILTQDVSDILSEYAWQEHAADSTADSTTSSTTSSTSDALRSLPAEQQVLVTAIVQHGSPLLDDLMLATGKEATELLPMLMLLELQGVVQSLPGGRYVCR